jgi:hypothetical protein
MKPAQHPDFFRLSPPPGQSRESGIVLDRSGVFWHRGEKITRKSMREAFFRWLRRHPDDGRFILENGYDWTYIEVQGTPYFVESARVRTSDIEITLSDGSKESLQISSVSVGPADALHCRVKGGRFDARFKPGAQLGISDALAFSADGRPVLRAGSEETTL